MRAAKYFYLLFVLSRCNSLFFQGDKEKWRQPESINIRCDREWIQSQDGTRLQTMYCPAKDQPKGVIVQFHGNAQNMYAHYQFLSWLIAEGYALATFDYRGYGESDGKSDRQGIYEDARAYIKHIRSKLSHTRRIFYGQSLGGAILMRAIVDEGLREEEVYVFEGSFASYQRVARTVLARKWFLWPLQWLAYILVTDSFAPHDLGLFSDKRVLIIHGDNDPVVEFSNGVILSYAMKRPLWAISEGGHLDTWYKNHGELRPELLRRLAAIPATRQPR